jgi:hypothetical protein
MLQDYEHFYRVLFFGPPLALPDINIWLMFCGEAKIRLESVWLEPLSV